MNRRQFLRTLPVLPLVAFANGKDEANPEDAEHRAILDQVPGIRPYHSMDAGPAHLSVIKALTHFVRKQQ